jgi:hypothetical protein
VTLNLEWVTANEERSEKVVNRCLNYRWSVEGLPQTDDTRIGVDMDPDVVRLGFDADGFDLCNLHGFSFRFGKS